MSDNLWPLAHDGMKRILSSCQNRLASQARLQHQASAEQSYLDRWLKSKKNGEWNQKCEEWKLKFNTAEESHATASTQNAEDSEPKHSAANVVGSAYVTLVAANNVTATASTSGSSSASKSNAGTGTHRKCKAKEKNSTSGPKRKYSFDYLHQGFFYWWDTPNPHCVLCYETLVNESMKSAHLKRHFERKQKDCIGKPLAFF